ncbi:sugar transporter [Loktanella sp. D2R18]|uniref:polysaccharide biosynthesis/export family protein n=1 Tax=Rhodobacterales TaxID=204455 RepID=UPI000DE94C53|nr:MULTISPECIES: polysaccharide biosynthesis/export family protein [Rhodobacterales]MDO6590386.1 polysaccharide biosynthesis/export family protein [Yoonia sp. 1_MG-2023]RBW41115.1 sugar transporter [Loktanella sp. D2R18]
MLFAVLVLQGCGAAYVSPKVQAEDGVVTVVPLTAQAIETANQSPYSPRAIPAAFTQQIAANASNGVQGMGVLPVLGDAPQPRQLATRIPPQVDPEPYKIGIGDIVRLTTQPETNRDTSSAPPDEKATYTVQDDGMISIPAVGRVMLLDLTLAQAEARLFESFVSARIDPTFSLEMAEFHAQSVVIGGAVAAPVSIPITLTPIYLDEAISRAGGVAVSDGTDVSIRIYRGGSLYQLLLSEYLTTPEFHKIRLLGGDSIYIDTEFSLERAQVYFEQQITLAQTRNQARAQAVAALTAELNQRRATLAVRRTNFQDQLALDAVARDDVYLTGEVIAPGRFTLPFGREATLADALFSEGGFTSQTANPAQIYVLRAGYDGAVTAWQLDARNVANLVLATQMNLRPNDIIFIAEQPVTRWHRVVQQMVPSLITGGAALAAN